MTLDFFHWGVLSETFGLNYRGGQGGEGSGVRDPEAPQFVMLKYNAIIPKTVSSSQCCGPQAPLRLVAVSTICTVSSATEITNDTVFEPQQTLDMFSVET